MPRAIKIGIIVLTITVVLPIACIIALFAGAPALTSSPDVRREILLPNHDGLIIDGKKSSRSEHGFSQRAGYRSQGSTEIEWFGDLSDGVEPQVYQTGPLVVVIDLPSAQMYVRTHVVQPDAETKPDRASGLVTPPHTVRPGAKENWKNLVLIFPDDLGPFPISYYAEKNGLTPEEVSRINELGGKRGRKYPTTYIQSFDPDTRDLKCSYHVDNTSSWPLHLRLSTDGTRLALIGIGESAP